MRPRLTGSDPGIVVLVVLLELVTGIVVTLPGVALVVIDERRRPP